LELLMRGEIVIKCTPHIGYLHRCFEKHTEYLTYKQIIPYTDRLDYLSSMNNNHVFCMGVEKLYGIDKYIPIEIEYIRVLMVELNRIASHLMFIGTYSMDLGSITPFLWAFSERENIIKLLESVSGSRLLYNYISIGSVYKKISSIFFDNCKYVMIGLIKKLNSLKEMLNNNIVFIKRTANIGILPLKFAINYGCSGPVLRASGLKWDLRKIDKYSIYSLLNFDIPYGINSIGVVGDCWNRFNVRLEEIYQSIDMVYQCMKYLKKLPKIEIINSNKKIYPLYKEYYIRGENPRGELGFYFVTQDNSEIPLRCKVRAPSFANLQIISTLCINYTISDLIAILGSIDIVLGEVDR
ncbi:MAG: NADH-quinone oxidoreductase subunit D, partial [Bacteroides sp.]